MTFKKGEPIRFVFESNLYDPNAFLFIYFNTISPLNSIVEISGNVDFLKFDLVASPIFYIFKEGVYTFNVIDLSSETLIYKETFRVSDELEEVNHSEIIL